MNDHAARPAIVTLAVAILLAIGLVACGGDDGGNADEAVEDAATERVDEGDPNRGLERAPESAEDVHPDPPDAGIGDRPGGGGEEDPGPPTREPKVSQEREIERTVRQYLRALREHDGERLCDEIFVEGALEAVRLPAERNTCAASVGASIGHPAERGGTRWLGARLTDARTVIMVDGGDGRVTATMANRLSTTDRTWIEDDVIYLRQVGPADAGAGRADAGADGTRGARWRIVKPSAVFYRAVGYVDIPIRALTPP